MWEMQLAQAAQQKSQNQQVKQLAQRIQQDHQQMAQALQKVIEQQGLQSPQSLSLEKQHALQVMQSQSGEDFDKCFLSAMKCDHAKDVSKFEDMSKIAKDDAVKQFASQQLPTLQQHYQQVQQTAVACGLPSGTEASPAGARIPGSGNGTSGGTSGGTNGGTSSGTSGGTSGGSQK